MRNRFFLKKLLFSHLNCYKQLLRDNWVQNILETCKISIFIPEESKIIISFMKQQILQYTNEKKKVGSILPTGSERVKIQITSFKIKIFCYLCVLEICTTRF